ncbi:four helix bundle protein [Chryseobacterium sp. MHB01]|nr:four helix bundle protein [Chryseobacterium sp. MHB01]
MSVKHGAKRKYEKSLFQNLQILKARQEQTQTWLQFARSCEYINEE